MALFLGSWAASVRAAQSPATTTSLLRVAFNSPTRGVGLFETASSRGRCVLYTRPTSDGGASFGRKGALLVRTRCGTGEPFSQVTFTGTGLLLAYGPRLEVSRDMGATWAAPTVPGSVVSVTAIGRFVWALVTHCGVDRPRCQLTLLVSDDGGATWSVQAMQPPDTIVSSSTAYSGELGEASLLAVTPTSTLLLALPAPLSTTSKPTPASATTEAIGSEPQWTTSRAACGAFEQSELAVAADGTAWLLCAGEPAAGQQLKSLAVSSHGGTAWQTVARLCIPNPRCHDRIPTSGYLDGLFALSSRTAFYVGYRSSLTGTFDGGKTWRTWPRIGGQDTGTAQVTFINQRVGWALAQDPNYTSTTLWRTADGGRTWSRA